MGSQQLIEKATDVIDGYTWHSGGGIFLARLDLDENPEGPHILVSDAADWDGSEGWLICLYPAYGEDAAATAITADEAELKRLAESYRERAENL